MESEGELAVAEGQALTNSSESTDEVHSQTERDVRFKLEKQPNFLPYGKNDIFGSGFRGGFGIAPGIPTSGLALLSGVWWVPVVIVGIGVVVIALGALIIKGLSAKNSVVVPPVVAKKVKPKIEVPKPPKFQMPEHDRSNNSDNEVPKPPKFLVPEHRRSKNSDNEIPNLPKFLSEHRRSKNSDNKIPNLPKFLSESRRSKDSNNDHRRRRKDRAVDDIEPSMEDVERLGAILMAAFNTEQCVQRILCEAGFTFRKSPASRLVLRLVRRITPEPLQDSFDIVKSAADDLTNDFECSRYICGKETLLPK